MNNQQFMIIKQLPKTILINSIKAIPDKIITLTTFQNDNEVIISGKQNHATVKAIR